MAAISEDFPAPTCPTTATKLPRGMLTLTLNQQKDHYSKEMDQQQLGWPFTICFDNLLNVQQ